MLMLRAAAATRDGAAYAITPALLFRRASATLASITTLLAIR